MKTLISFGLASLVVFSCHAQTNNDIKYKHLVYQQAMNGMFFKEGKVFFIIDCQLQQVVKLHDSTFYLFARTGTAASGKKRFTSIDTIIIHNDILEYNANFFNLDTVNTNDYQLMASLDTSIDQLAKGQGRCRTHFARLIKLSYLAPDIVTMVLEGRQPASLNRRKLMAIELPAHWADQRALLGCN